MARREYTAGRATTLASAFAIGAGTFTIADDGSENTWPTSANYDFFVTIGAGTSNEERVLCSERNGRVITVAASGRGKDDTGEKNHAAGETVWPSLSAQDVDEANAHIESTGYASFSKSVHGLGSGDGVVVGTDKSQTLTNKTIDSASNTMTVAQSAVTNLVSDLAAKAPIANPTFTGTVAGVTKSMVGLANVDNTSDANKPISTATQAALDGKSGTAHGHDYAASGHGHSYLPLSGGTVSGNIEANFYYSTAGFQSAGGTIETLGGGPIQTNGVEINGTIVRPRTGGTGSVGSSGQRFIKVFTTQAADVSSDRRLKSEITDSALGLDFINDLRPVSYKLLSDEENRVHYGLIAQEVKEAVDNSGVSDFGGWCENPGSTQSLAYDEFTAPLIKAIQELSAEVAALKSQLNQS